MTRDVLTPRSEGCSLEDDPRVQAIDGHPDAGSYRDALARAQVDGARAAGHEERLNLQVKPDRMLS